MAKQKVSPKATFWHRNSSERDHSALLNQLASSSSSADHLSTPVEQRYFDTFEGQLQRAGWHLLEETSADQHRLLLFRDAPGGECYTCETTGSFLFATDLPDGDLRDMLIKLIYPRALLLLVTFHFNELRYHLNNSGKKKAVDISVRKDMEAIDPATWERVKLGTLVDVLPAKKNNSLCKNLQVLLQEEAGFEKTDVPLLELGLEAIEKPRCGHSSKFNVVLDPRGRADEAVKIIGRHLLKTMDLNQPGILADLDSEFLHDYRIAVRRSRSLLSQLKALFPPDILQRFITEFKWLGHATSPLRDLDVYLLSFESNAGWIPASMKKDLEPMRAFLVREQRCAHTALVKELASARYARFKLNWTNYLDSPVHEPPVSKDAGQPVLKVASRRIWKDYRTVMKQGLAILSNPNLPATALHEMRISCKKLRYLMEMFASLYPKKVMRRIINPLKKLQDNLGDFQDFEIQQLKIHVYAEQMTQDRNIPPDTFLAMGRLEAHLEGLQKNARHDFDGCFKNFAKPTIRKQFKQLFHTAKS